MWGRSDRTYWWESHFSSIHQQFGTGVKSLRSYPIPSSSIRLCSSSMGVGIHLPQETQKPTPDVFTRLTFHGSRPDHKGASHGHLPILCLMLERCNITGLCQQWSSLALSPASDLPKRHSWETLTWLLLTGSPLEPAFPGFFPPFIYPSIGFVQVFLYLSIPIMWP